MPALRNVCPIRESDPMRPPTWKTLTGVLCGVPAIPEESVREWVLLPVPTWQSSRCRCRRKSLRVRFLRNKPPQPALRRPNRYTFGSLRIGVLLHLSMVVILERTRLRPPTQFFQPLLHLIPSRFASIAMFTVGAVDSQEGQRVADPRSQVHNPPRRIRVIRLRGAASMVGSGHGERVHVPKTCARLILGGCCPVNLQIVAVVERGWLMKHTYPATQLVAYGFPVSTKAQRDVASYA